jgi:DNA-binding response OmpR family regulator
MRNAHFKLLIADDDVGSAEALAVYMRLSGFDVETVFEGLGALFALTTWPPHAAFLDIDMPGATGLEVARAVRLHEADQRQLC